VKVLGAAITYGSGGPKVPVRISASFDKDKTWSDLFSGSAVESGNEQIFSNLPSDTPLTLRFNGRYSWLFNKTFQSDARDGHTYILRNGDTPPDYAPFDNQASLESFLKPYINAQGRISIGPKDLLYLVELSTLSGTTADFQDAVVLVSFTEKAQTCTDASKPRVKISFDRLENMGTGNATKAVIVGPQKLAFAENQWIPLVDSNGTTIIDGGLVKNVPGIAFERGDGWIHLLSYGSHLSSSGKEIIDARVEFNKAYITTIETDSQDPVENPWDGVINDTAQGDEFINGPNAKSMFFKTRVTAQNDGVYIHWQEGQPSDAGSTSSTSSMSSSSSSSSTSSESSSEAAVDPCAVPYQVSTNGLVTTNGKADISVRIAGSESTYGNRGPRIPIWARISFDGGTTWRDLFGARSIRGGEFVVFRDIAAGSRIALSFNGRYSWVFNKTVESGRGDSRIHVLRHGETFLGLPGIVARGELKGFLRNLLDEHGKAKVGSRDVVFLTELADNANPNFHDAVAVVSIDKAESAGGCGGSTYSSSSSSSSTSSTASVGSSSSSSAPTDEEDSDNDGIKNSHDWCPYTTKIPESVPTEYLLFDRYAITGSRGAAGSLPVFRQGPRKRVGGYTLSDTHGCSCSDLLDVIDNRISGNLHRFADRPILFRSLKSLFAFYVDASRQFGCSDSLMRLVSQEH